MRRSTLLLVVLAAPSLARQADVPPELAPARERVLALLEAQAAPSIVVGVGRHGKVLWAEGFGLADVERGLEATPSTPYRVASLTKSITGTGLALLAAEGAIDLDAPVARWLGDDLRVCAGRPEAVTLRRVLAHEAGIPHGWESHPWSAEEAARERSGIAHALVAFPPGRRFLYSNYAYGVAEAVLAAASGTSYRAFLQERLFDPLGMTDGGPVLTAELVARAATEYDGGRRPLPPARFVPAGGAGALASVNDLLRYGFFHLGDLDLPADASVRPASAARVEKPLGFGCAELADGRPWILSNGRFGGVCSNLTLVRPEGWVVAVLANAGTMLADELATSIVDDLVPGFEASVQAFVREFEAGLALPRYAPAPALLGDWEGRIVTPVREVPFTLSFDEDGAAWLTWDDAHEGRLRELRGNAEHWTAGFEAPLPWHPSHDGPIEIELELVRDEERLVGSAVGYLRSSAGSFALPAPVSLARVE